MTFSIVARDATASMFGVAVASSSPAVAARCAHARAGIGAVATQNITDPALGPYMLERMREGSDAPTAIDAAVSASSFGGYRQLLAIGVAGPPGIHSGAYALGIVASAQGPNAAAAGNLLAAPGIPAAMIAAFEADTSAFGCRLLRALRAAVDHGGEAGPIHSAGLLIVREVAWPVADLRIDWSNADPVAELAALWQIYAPQLDDYVRRAQDPANAPRYGVPGNQ